ncbi:MAG: hypothetical protein U0984_02880 [Prosthecobacter sp.]|nr:hypothetical protein [Prosthecobacter sp.]
MKHFLILALLFLVSFAAQGAEPTSAASPALHLKPADVERVEIRLEPKSDPQVRVYLANAKLKELQSLTQNDLAQPISIFMNDKFIVAPQIKEPFSVKIRFMTLRYSDFDSATQIARLFMPTK